MGMYDTVRGIPEEYDSQFKCWGSLMYEYEVGEMVGPLLKHSDYSIRLNSKKGIPSRFLLVVDKHIKSVCEPQPLGDSPLFDKWGRELAVRGENAPLVLKHPMEEAIQEAFPGTQSFTHEFQLRDDFVVELELPVDVTEDEIRRVTTWVQLLHHKV